MFDIDAFKKTINYRYYLYKEYVKLFIYHFLGEDYEINLDNIMFKDIANIANQKSVLELRCGSNKIAEVKFVGKELKIYFYDMGQGSKMLRAIINFNYKTSTSYKVEILEFMYDESIIYSKIEGIEDYNDNYENKHIIGYRVYTTINYYNPSDFKYFDEEDKMNESNFGEYKLDSLCFKPDHSVSHKKTSRERFNDNTSFLEFIDARKELDEKVAGTTQQLVMEK